MIWHRLQVVLSLFGDKPEKTRAAAEVARRWVKARRGDPELVGDVIRLGGVMAAQPFENAEVADLDPQRLAYEAGRRDLALQLCALMELSVSELNDLMGDDNV